MNLKWKSDFEFRLCLVDWASLNHAFGSATNVPGELMRFVEIGDGDAGFVLNDFFYTRLTHQGTRSSATLAAVPFLVELLEQLPLQRSFLINYLVDIALGYSGWHFPNGYRLENGFGAYMTDEFSVQLYERVQELAFPIFLRLAQHDESKSQIAALWALGWFPAREGESRPVLESSSRDSARFALRMLDASRLPFCERSDEEAEADEEEYDELIREIYG